METRINNFALHQGKIVYVPDAPEKPQYIDIRNGAFASIAGSNLSIKDRYESALQSAVASGKEVENQDEVLDQLWRHDERINSPIPFLYWKENMLPRTKDMLYPLQCRVEVTLKCQNGCSDCIKHEIKGCVFKTVARVTFEQPENLTNKYETGEGWLTRKPEAAGQEQEISNLKEHIQMLQSYVHGGFATVKIVCYCGSLRVALEAFKKAEYDAVIKGEIALLPCCMFVDIQREYGAESDYKIKADEVHKRKIDICDEVFVLNVGGYIGESTRSEIEYAKKLGKPIKYLEP